ncbi:putative lipid II flippase FtsW [Paenibacillus elgii]|uniref:Probable peptidoglycan glycosyltransferase FtsW n=1 Tax=Paenibacillus elgii TaxID=189691 RepID=A0A164ANB9_9BACL|nr:putative lipid II flippase FtsW [Paenibacillus elgii]KZE84259.1 rod shape-determining protein RodA [Paenibacillus elgii]NEN82687.1 putative lipid II flippase FtsW [Paenibacillus elgii]PUA35473.1 putative lipid II flippase FtsW [Paenibacillus elgii]
MTTPRRGTPDFLLLFLTFSLVCFGLAFVFSASMAYRASDPWYLAVKQAIFAGVGTIVMFFCMNVDFRKFQKWVIPALFVVSMLLLLVPIVGKVMNGATSWLRIGGLSLQPTEFAKLAIIVYLASIISKKGDRFQDFKRGLMPPLVVIGFISALIMMQPDLGSTMVLVLCAMLIIIVGGAQLKHVFYLGTGGVVFLTIVGMIYYIVTNGTSHHFARFTAYWNPAKDPHGSGFQLMQSLYAFGHGGLTGAGFGQSVQKLHYLPEAHNDFIFAIIGEELGFIGTFLFLLAYLAFLWRGLIVALRCQDTFGMLLGVGIVGMIGIQAFINMGGVTNTIPMTGVTLPLISYGGTSMLTTLAGLGILLSISREYNKPEKERETKKRA